MNNALQPLYLTTAQWTMLEKLGTVLEACILSSGIIFLSIYNFSRFSHVSPSKCRIQWHRHCPGCYRCMKRWRSTLSPCKTVIPNYPKYVQLPLPHLQNLISIISRPCLISITSSQQVCVIHLSSPCLLIALFSASPTPWTALVPMSWWSRLSRVCKGPFRNCL